MVFQHDCNNITIQSMIVCLALCDCILTQHDCASFLCMTIGYDCAEYASALHLLELSPKEHSVGFFDGAALNWECGVGFVIQIDKDKFIRGWLKGGMGTNTKAKVIGISSLLYCANSWGIK